MSNVWLPIAGSGISYTLVGSGNAVVNGSDVSATLGFGSCWDLTLASPVNVRVTAVSYQGDPPGAYPGQISAETSDGQQEIINEGGPSAWAPSPMVFNSATEVHYAPGAEESSAYQFLIEVQAPTALGPLITQQCSYQAVRGADVQLQCWLRNEAGRVDASQMDLQVEAFAYGRRHVQVTWQATGNAEGRIQFTVPNGHKLNGGLYQMRIRVEPSGGLVSLGLLEIV